MAALLWFAGMGGGFWGFGFVDMPVSTSFMTSE